MSAGEHLRAAVGNSHIWSSMQAPTQLIHPYHLVAAALLQGLGHTRAWMARALGMCGGGRAWSWTVLMILRTDTTCGPSYLLLAGCCPGNPGPVPRKAASSSGDAGITRLGVYTPGRPRRARPYLSRKVFRRQAELSTGSFEACTQRQGLRGRVLPMAGAAWKDGGWGQHHPGTIMPADSSTRTSYISMSPLYGISLRPPCLNGCIQRQLTWLKCLCAICNTLLQAGTHCSKT